MESSTNILIVDDHPMVRRGLTQLIDGQSSMKVVGEAEGMAEAISLTESLMPDLVIVDISLRDGSGLGLIQQIRKLNSSIKILAFSMHDESLYAERALRAGAAGYLNKEEPPELLIEALKMIVEGQVYLSPRMTTRIVSHAYGTVTSVPNAPVDVLSDRELEVFELIGRGRTTRQIATTLHLSIKTIETHRERIKEKLGLKGNMELIRNAIRWDFEKGNLEAHSSES